ncbi:glycosyltransferase [Streptomyces phaeochromogenes]|uniref:glycosyltransferase n=1 Tax=Streptomyces phaeochromogenes TaxID=1923 RepID=UPI0033D0F945
MKITFLLHNAHGITATVRAVTNLAGALAARHEVEIVSCYRTADRMPLAVADGVRVRALVDLRPNSRHDATDRADLRVPGTVCPQDETHTGPTPPSRLGEARLAAHLRNTDADVVIATRPYLVCFLADYGRSDYLRIGQEHRTRDLHTAALRSDLDAAISRLDAYVTLTQADLRAYRAAIPHSSFPRARTRLASIPVCCSASGVEPSTGDSKIVLAAGRLTPMKRHDRLLDAFAEVTAKHPDWRLRIYGRGAERARLLRRIGELGLHNNVLLMGARTPMEPEWAKAAIAVLPHAAEPSGAALVEAMACGVPVLSTDCDHAPREIIEPGVNGLIVPGDGDGDGDGDGAVVDALADAMCRLIENEPERRGMAEAALKNAERFRPERISAQYETLFADCRSEPGGGTRSSGKAGGGPRLWRRTRRLVERLGARRPGSPVTVNCRVLKGGSLIFQVPGEQLTPGPWELLLCPRRGGSGDLVRLPLEGHEREGDGPARALLEKRHWELAEGDWDVRLARTGGIRSRRVRAGLVETARLLDPDSDLRPERGEGRFWIPYATQDGELVLRARLRPAHAEVTAVEVGDETVRLTGSLRGRTARAHHYRFRARIPGERATVLDAPCYVDPRGDFDVTVPVRAMAEHHPGREALWELRLTAYGGPELRLGMVSGDLVDRRDVCVFPVGRYTGSGGSALTVSFQLTHDHDLVLRTTVSVPGLPRPGESP